MRKSYRLLAASVCSALAGLGLAVSAAAAPPGFNFQGRLTDANGVNRDGGPFSIKFTIFDAASGGNALWIKTFPSITVRNGNFQTVIGDPADNPSQTLSAAFAGDSRFLEIQVLSGPGVGSPPEPPMVPRQQLVSVPYSFQSAGIVSAGPATIVVGGSEQMRVTSGGAVGIGTTNPTNPLSVSGNANVTGTLSAGTLSGSGGGLSGVPWSGLAGFPGGCPGGQFVTSVGGSLSCAAPPAPASTNGSIVNSAHAETNASIYTGALMAEGDNIPQITEGTEIMSVTITPKSARDKLLIMVRVPYGTDSTKPVTVAALFRDNAGTDALSTSYNFANDSGHMLEHNFRYYMTAGTTDSMTFRVRVGVATSWSGYALTLNGTGGGPFRWGGGTSYADIDVLEIGAP